MGCSPPKTHVSKARLRLPINRYFYEGCCKVLLEKWGASAGSINTERCRPKALLCKYIPQRIKRVITSPRRPAEVSKLAILVRSTAAVCLGFACGLTRQEK
jgi:hypothetical protein